MCTKNISMVLNVFTSHLIIEVSPKNNWNKIISQFIMVFIIICTFSSKIKTTSSTINFISSSTCLSYRLRSKLIQNSKIPNQIKFYEQVSQLAHLQLTNLATACYTLVTANHSQPLYKLQLYKKLPITISTKVHYKSNSSVTVLVTTNKSTQK